MFSMLEREERRRLGPLHVRGEPAGKGPDKIRVFRARQVHWRDFSLQDDPPLRRHGRQARLRSFVIRRYSRCLSSSSVYPTLSHLDHTYLSQNARHRTSSSRSSNRHISVDLERAWKSVKRIYNQHMLAHKHLYFWRPLASHGIQ